MLAHCAQHYRDKLSKKSIAGVLVQLLCRAEGDNCSNTTRSETGTSSGGHHSGNGHATKHSTAAAAAAGAAGAAAGNELTHKHRTRGDSGSSATEHTAFGGNGNSSSSAGPSGSGSKHHHSSSRESRKDSRKESTSSDNTASTATAATAHHTDSAAGGGAGAAACDGFTADAADAAAAAGAVEPEGAGAAAQLYGGNTAAAAVSSRLLALLVIAHAQDPVHELPPRAFGALLEQLYDACAVTRSAVMPLLPACLRIASHWLTGFTCVRNVAVGLHCYCDISSVRSRRAHQWTATLVPAALTHTASPRISLTLLLLLTQRR
jgi:hypothetical protein